MELARQLLKWVLLYPAEIAALLTAVAMVASVRIRPWLAWSVAAVGLVAFALVPLIDPPSGTDLGFRWHEGLAVRQGEDPYLRPMCLYLPTALPLLALLSYLPFPTLLLIWSWLLVAGSLPLVELTRRTLRQLGGSEAGLLPAAQVGVLSAAVVLSYACRYGFEVAQLSLLTTLALLAALCARQKGQPVRAGLWLTLASVKAATMLPFLLLFHRRADWRSWLTLGSASLLLSLLAAPVAELPQRWRGCLANIDTASRPGSVNDYAMHGRNNAEMIALDKAISLIGVEDRGQVRSIQYLVLGMLGAWVAWRVCGRQPLSPPAACSLVAFYASLFLYHRLYDMIVLVLPLVYATSQARVTTGRVRVCYASCAVAILGVLFLRVENLKALTAVCDGAGLGSLVLRIVVLPYGTWLTLAGMFLLGSAEHRHPAGLPSARPLRPAASKRLFVGGPSLTSNCG